MFNPVALDYADCLQDVLRGVFSRADIPHLVLRDGETLPRASGFDIDVLLSEESVSAFVEHCRACAVEAGILVFVKGKRIALFAPSYDRTHRNWVVMDLQTVYSYGTARMDLKDMLAMPEAERKTLIRDVQDARKGRASKEVQERLEITPYAKKTETSPTFLQKCKRVFLERAFFVHYHSVPFIVISGPDGVGKTTLLNNILRLFETLPFQTNSFHHTGLTKDKNASPKIVREEEMSLGRRLRRRFTPASVKKIYGAVSGEVKYAITINKEILKGFYTGMLVFSDRYIYDRAIKMRMIPGKMSISKITTRINARLMRKPMAMIVPTDEPQAIFKRKQELTPDEIALYYTEMDKMLCGAPCVHKIGVAGKSPEELALEATQKILRSLEPMIFNLIGMYEKNLKRS